jgi:tripartite-type tricarboxylate transporter receptor subunit TctC
MFSKKIIALAAIAPLAFGSTAALAAYPEKPIKLVIPYRAGGGSDALARTIQAAIEKHKILPVKLVVTNVTGAGGAVGLRHVKDAKPDGYTFLQIHNGFLAFAATNRINFGPEAFHPVAQTTQSCLYLATSSAQPFKSFADVVKAAKAAPGKLKAADSIGGVSHFPWVTLMNATGTKVGIVHTGGTSKRFASMKGGHTQMAFMSPGWIKRGGDQLRGLLWLGPTRHPAAPNMPTAIEQGYNISACLNRRFWAPKATSAKRVAYFADILKKVMATAELKAYHKKRMGSIRILTGAKLKADIEVEYKLFQKVAPVVKASMKKKK